MSWREITLYISILVIVIVGGALGVLSHEVVAQIMSSVVAFLVGRQMPAPGQKPATEKAGS